MTIYQEEMQRKAHRFGYSTQYNEEAERMAVLHDGQQLAEVSPEGFLYYKTAEITGDDNRAVLAQLRDEVPLVREYAGLYEASPPMKANGVQEYRQIAEYGDIVFGAMCSPKHGFMFSSWSQSRDKMSVVNGDYSPDYLYSKEAFAVRAKMVDKNRLFTGKEAENLYRCVDFAMGNCETLTYEQEQQLKDLMKKLTCGYPQLEDHPPSFEPSDAQQLNM